ncbi:CDP-diacylglycerol--glycerol-3-phosphate 3-phosphatidyltransferase 1, chloroplastic [Morella rubra]|uniref:CDP-diacylglycerol--glycerol-3-phosphate 1-phosphatidyltransferase n=1 Tax=Morella rubra TaxID=262757 RepID=A0A6A1W113_9ROSI|nr:CDP-diacylglycerol--glycerol-3-phosphate 3-phosphatidyltransferase 1, chloroplastic [Morella rubra]
MAAASICTHKNCGGHHNLTKWVRTAHAATADTLVAKQRPKPKLLQALYSISNKEQRPVNYKHWWRITPWAPLTPSAHDNGFPKTLGFRSLHHNICRAFSSRGSSSEEKGGYSASGSGSSGSGVVADMGSESKDPLDLFQSPSSVQNQRQQQEQEEQESSKLLTLPTILTLARVAAVPLLLITDLNVITGHGMKALHLMRLTLSLSSAFYNDSWWGATATTSIFIAASVTDWLDGYLARKMRQRSAFGAFLDPVADKLMVAATLVLLCSRPVEVSMFGQVPWLLAVPSIAIIGREITMSAVREWAASQNSQLLEAVAVNNLGKWKTATQMIALTILLATRDGSFGGPGILVASGIVLLYISAGLAVWSLAVYMRKIWRVLLR